MEKNKENIVLFVDDDIHVIEGLLLLFEDDYSVLSASSGKEAIQLIKENESIAVVVMDIKMPNMDGIAAARKIRILRPNLAVIFHTGFAGQYSEDDIDEHEKPFDYIQKGSSVSKLQRAVRNAVKMYELENSTTNALNKISNQYGMVGNSSKMKEIYKIISKVSPSDLKVMILGETGTGKELVAQAIHNNSSRNQQRLVIFNCNHKSPDLVESELFGHSKGAFTGAVKERVGLFEYADGGTVFLDEIGDLDITTQAKILRVLQSGEYQVIGKISKLIKTDVRLICATHHNLFQMVEEKKFREDLYYRLKGGVIQLPPLRERKEDIPLLVSKHADRLTIEKDQMPKYFDKSAMEVLMQYDWPGNVRQLLDTVESLLVMADSDIILDVDVNNYLGNDNMQSSLSQSLTDKTIEFRKNLIVGTLHETKNNINAAARKLQIDPANLRRLIKNYQIDIG